MVVWVLLALVCSGPDFPTSCHVLPGALPLEFMTVEGCQAFAAEASKEGMSYVCSPYRRD